jgi:hypothetical protein
MTHAPEPPGDLTDPDASSLVIRAKWTIDGAETLEDAARMAEKFAASLRGLASEGYELDGPVQDDYGWARRHGKSGGTA